MKWQKGAEKQRNTANKLKHFYCPVMMDRNVVGTGWEAVTALVCIQISMFLMCGLSWLPVQIPPHNSLGDYSLPNRVQMWCVREANCDFPCFSGYFYTAWRRDLSLAHCRSSEKSAVHTRMSSPALSCIVALRSLSFSPNLSVSNDKRSHRIWRKWHLTPLPQPSCV